MESIDLQLNLDPRGYVQGVGAAAAATAQLAAGQSQIQQGAGAVERALRVMTPKALTASFVAFTAVAASAESRLAGMQATASVTGQNMGRLTKTMNELARSFPVGNRGAQQIVQSLQQTGMAARGQEGRIAGLASAVTQLGAATGTSAPVIGRQMVQLNRAFGNTEIDPERFSKMSDSLTTLSAKSGASAESILQFSQNIAPLARSAGLGQTSVLGISTAFSKMGEDGFAASSAMNKMLADMNRSLRDGTPELNAYANIVGKTREEFQVLAKSNPAEALAQVTEAIGNAGPGQGQRMLEEIGIEGVRGQRAMAALTQAGGVREAVATATGAYGSGSTARAAEEAMDGLEDSMQRLGSSTEQIAQAFGTPLLGAVTKFVDVIGSVTGTLAKIASSGPVQALMKGLAMIGGGLATAAAVIATAFAARRMAGMLAMGGALTRNAPITAMRAAARDAQGRPLTDVQQRLLARVQADNDPRRLRQIANLQQMQANGGLTPAQTQRLAALQAQGVQGMVRAPAGRMAEVGRAYGEQRAANRAAREAGGSAGLGRTVTGWGAAATRGWNKIQTDLINQQRTEVGQRRTSVRFGADDMGRDVLPGGDKAGSRSGWGGKLTDSLKDAATGAKTFSQRTRDAGTALRAANKEIVGTRTTMGHLRSATSHTAKSMLQSAALIGKAGMMAGGAAMSGLGKLGGSALGMVGGAGGLAMIGGMLGYSALKGSQQSARERLEGDKNASITGTSDKYLEAMGKAADATMSFAAQAQQAATALARTEADNPTTVSAAEREAARTGKVVQGYAGGVGSVTEQINAQFGGNITPEQMSAIATDLLRTGQNDGQGYSEQDVNAILGGIRRNDPTSPYAQAGATGVDYNALLSQAGEGQEGTSIMQNAWRTISGAQGSTGGGWKDVAGKVLGAGRGTGIGWIDDKLEVGGAWNSIATTKEQESAVSAVRQGIAQNELRQTDTYGADYARQESYKEINAAMEAAQKTGNADLIARMSEQLSAQAGAKGQVVDQDLLREHDGNFIAALAAQDKSFRTRREEEAGRGITLEGPGLSATVQDSPWTKALDGVNLFGEAVSNRAGDIDKDVNKAMLAFRNMPGDLGKFRAAVDAMTGAALKSADGLAGGMEGAIATMNKVGDPANPIFKVAEASLREFERIQSMDRSGGTGAQIARSMRAGLTKANNAGLDPSNPANVALISEGRDQVLSGRNAAEDLMKQRIQAEMSYQRQMERAQVDYNKQREYAEEDFQRQMARTREDYGIQRVRQVANFNRQVERAVQDFHRGRRRAQRDFNIQLQRMNEDAAKSMYDPYKRMQVQATSDMGTLMVNLREQNEAMQNQVKNLERARAAGITNNTIDQLGLNKSENAQQLQRMIDDIAGGGDVAGLNSLIGDRMAAGGALNTDESNKDLKRQREDFNRTMADQAEDFGRSMDRQREDFNRGLREMGDDFDKSMRRAADDQQRGMDRMAEAFQKSMARAREDHALAQKEITGDYEALQKAMQDAINGNITSGTKLMKDTAVTAVKEIENVLKGMDPEIRRMILKEGVIQLNVSQDQDTPQQKAAKAQRARNFQAGMGDGEGEQPQGVQSMMSAIRSEFPGTRLHSGLRPGAVTATGQPSYHGLGRAVDIPPDMRLFDWIYSKYGKASKELIFSPAGGRQIKNGAHKNYTGVTRDMHYDHIHWAMAKGGITTRPTRALIGEAGTQEAVIPLNSVGVEVMAKAMQRYLDPKAIVGMGTGQARTHITYSSHVETHDNRTEVNGPITVQTQDPNAMLRALQAKARAANLTATPTRKGT